MTFLRARALSNHGTISPTMRTVEHLTQPPAGSIRRDLYGSIHLVNDVEYFENKSEAIIINDSSGEGRSMPEVRKYFLNGKGYYPVARCQIPPAGTLDIDQSRLNMILNERRS